MHTNSPDLDARRTTSAKGQLANAAGAVLAAAISVIHVTDQGGLTALKDPAYLGYGYWLLEFAGVITAVLLLVRARPVTWALAFGVAAGPLIGITISRSVGLPDATDDIGNWFEPLGMLAMAVELTLVTLSGTALARARATKQPRV